MKLIDILVEELPNRGGWPKGANCITQDGDLKVWPATCNASAAKCNDNGFWFLDSSRIGGFEVDTLASDYTTAIITREQYEAALAAKNDGWIEWSGGVIPISTNTFVDVKFNNGDARLGKIAGEYSWEHVWEDSNIIAYRLHQPQEVAHTEAEQEAELNECIGQPPVTTWSGEGLPPVGCECEFMKHTPDAMPNWRRGIIKYVSEYTVVIVDALSPGEFVAHPCTCDFRPIRSEAERKRDEVVAQLNNFVAMGKFALDEDLACAVYDAIAAGKIPGVKLED